MPLPPIVARLNRYTINPLTRRFAGRIAPFAMIEHRGRTSGKVYHLPIMAFPTDSGFVVALTYGPDADWVKNVLAAGECTLTYRKEAIPLVDPILFQDDPRHQPFPRIVKRILKLNGVDYFLTLQRRG
jgi:deazaflavin-dependent oxidoreductase (nitroreductase family)